MAEATLHVKAFPPKHDCIWCKFTGKLLTTPEDVTIRIPSACVIPCYPCGWLLSNQNFATKIPNADVAMPGVDPNRCVG